MAGRKSDFTLPTLDDLFSTQELRDDAKLSKIRDIPLELIDDFPDHPFKVKLDEDMDQLVQSIKERGIITPVTLRPKEDGRYEIVSGHRRRKACELAGFDTVKAEVREMTRDEAIILMVESNLQRSTILPSEKAFSYKMRLEAMKRQGQRTDLTSCPVGTKLNSAGEIAQQSSDSERQVFRYIRLTELLPEVQKKVDSKEIAFSPAVELSYLTHDEQKQFLDAMDYSQNTPSLSQAQRLKKLSREGKCTKEAMRSIMAEGKKEEQERITLSSDTLRKYFPRSYTPLQMQQTIIKLLEQWQKKQQRRNER